MAERREGWRCNKKSVNFINVADMPRSETFIITERRSRRAHDSIYTFSNLLQSASALVQETLNSDTCSRLIRNTKSRLFLFFMYNLYYNYTDTYLVLAINMCMSSAVAGLG